MHSLAQLRFRHPKALTNLIQPHMGDFIIGGRVRARRVDAEGAVARAREAHQIAALPLGARLVVDPWSDRLDLIRTPAVPLTSARENVPLAVTPLMPFIRYAETPANSTSSR